MAFLVVMAAAVVVGAAYGIDRLGVVVHKFYVEHHHSGPRAPGVTNKATSTTTTTSEPGLARCDGPQLSAVVSDWRETSGTVEETVSLNNISASPCSLTGYPRLGAGAQNGTPLPAPNDDVASFASPTVGTTAAPRPVTLARGSRASFELAFANTCDSVLQPGEATTGGTNECYAGIWLEVTPPLGTSPLLVTQPVRLTYAASGFQVGPVQAGDGLPLTGQPPPTGPTTTSPSIP